MEIEVYKPALAYTDSPEIKIYDERGILFYNSAWAKRFTGVFSLPKGKYSTSAPLKIIRPLKRNKLKLLKFERRKPHNWEDFTIQYGNNPHKCTIYHGQKRILFDTSFKDAPKYQLMFILLHEKGHKYYKSEAKADHYAIRGMWLRGYNKSQIGLAPLLTLSPRSYERKKQVINYLIKRLK